MMKLVKVVFVASIFITSIVPLNAQSYRDSNPILNSVSTNSVGDNSCVDSCTPLGVGDSGSYTVEVEESGWYDLEFSYVALGSGVEDVIYKMRINDTVQYDEMNNLKLDYQWVSEAGDFITDRYGNQIQKQVALSSNVLKDNVHTKNQLNTMGMKVNLNAGVNTIDIELIQGSVEIKEIKALGESIVSYDAYKVDGDIIDTEVIVLEGESPSNKNEAFILTNSDNSVEATPHSARTNYINTIGGVSYDTAGTSISYEVSVPEAGMYPLGIKYKNTKDFLPTSIDILVNGNVPFTEASNYHLPFTTEFSSHEFGNDTEQYYFYLNEGVNNISFKINQVDYENTINELNLIFEEMNKIYLDVKKISGSSTNALVSFEMEKYIPGITEQLSSLEKRLITIQSDLTMLLPEGYSSKGLEYLNSAILNINKFVVNPNSLPSDLNNFYGSTSSVGTYISNARTELGSTPLILDQVYIGGDVESYPEFKAGVVKSSVNSITRFVDSFLPQEVKDDVEYTKEIDVWVNRSRVYVDQLQLMIDQEFTPKTGIKVNLSIMNNEQKLLLSNAANDTPDVVLGTSSNLPYEYGLRNAAYDMTEFEDFKTVVNDFYPASLVPYAVDGGVYAIPESLDFNTTFYRTDIFQNLGIEVPKTWVEVENLMSTLERYSMTYYTSLSAGAGTKTFSQTSPFLMQNGCSAYNDETYLSDLQTPECVAALTLMEEMFTVYGLPLQVPNFFEYFRTGKAPVGTGTYGTYLQLKMAAPEIEGMWEMAPFPGVLNENGVINNVAPASSNASIIMEKSDDIESSWEFMKWWQSSEVQADYANRMYFTYGPEFLWMSANKEGFKNSPLPSNDKAIIVNQWENMDEIARIPGSYMVERSISNAWNQTVFDGINSRTALDEATIESDKEIIKKMQEFGYYEDGTKVLEYDIPTTEEMRLLQNE
jgi:ABC-type glycerol-3-phosphate transport system substrate-binding protein